MKLLRVKSDSVETLGVLLDMHGKEVCKTLELPWRDNAPRVSCIPADMYICVRRWSNRFKRDVFEITGVPDRSAILIHPANFATELLGCIALGTSFADLNRDGVQDVASSRLAFDKFMASMKGVETFTLFISEANTESEALQPA